LLGILAFVSFAKSDLPTYHLDFIQNDNIDFTGNDLNYYNLKQKERYTGNYSGTYSFDGEVGEEGDDISWIGNDWSNEGCTISVLERAFGHESVLSFMDNNSSGECLARIPIGMANESMEFWLASSDADKMFSFYFTESGAYIMYFYIRDSHLYYRNGSGAHVPISDFYGSMWYHIRILWSDYFNTYDFFLNGHLVLDDEAYFHNTTVNPAFLYLRTTDADQNYSIFLDGVGYGWDSEYSMGENLIPKLGKYDLLERDRFEFWLNDTNSKYESGDKPSVFEYTETGNAKIEVKNGPTNYMYMYVEPSDICLFKYPINYDFTLLNISVYADITQGNDYAFEVMMDWGSDSSLVYLKCVDSGSKNWSVSWNDGSGPVLKGYITWDGYLKINLLVYPSGMTFVNINGLSFWDAYTLEITALEYIIFWNQNLGSGNCETYIDYIGIYDNGRPLTNEDGFAYYNSTKEWFFYHHPNLYIEAINSTFSLLVKDGTSYCIGDSVYTIFSNKFINGSYYENTFQSSGGYPHESYFFWVSNSSISYTFNLTSLSINGVALEIGGDIFFPSISPFYTSNQYWNFSIDDNGNLAFILKYSNNTEKEVVLILK